MVDENSLELIKERLDIVDIIGQYIKLKKRGTNFLGLCPFHNEKTPSFVVSPDKRIFHCFGCGAGGNAFTFLMKIDGLSFIDSVKVLAEQAGIEIDEAQMPEFKKDDREIGFSLLTKVKDFYHSQLTKKVANDYLQARGLSKETAQAYQIGYASEVFCDQMGDIKDHKDFHKEIADIGIGIDAQGKMKDRFYKRIIFPIIDLQGRTLGFGGRIIDGEGAKYVNSPETRFYHKSNVLYGLNAAKKFARESNGELILVEGYMDVVSMHQYGVKNVAAVLGTALTPQQLNLAKRFASKIFLCFDNDKAGKKAMYRVSDILQEADVEVRVIGLGDMKDPDEYIQEYGLESFQGQVSKAITYKDFLINHTIAIQSDNSLEHMNVEDKSRIVKELKSILRFNDEIVKTEYVKTIAKKLKVDVEYIKSHFFTYNSMSISKRKKYNLNPKKKDKYHKLSEDILAVLINHVSLREEFLQRFKVDDFMDIDHKKIFSLIGDNVDKDVQHLCNISSDSGLVGICMKDNYPDPKFFLEEALVSLKKKINEENVSELKKQIIQLEKSGDFDKIKQLNQQLSELIKNK